MELAHLLVAVATLAVAVNVAVQLTPPKADSPAPRSGVRVLPSGQRQAPRGTFGPGQRLDVAGDGVVVQGVA